MEKTGEFERYTMSIEEFIEKLGFKKGTTIKNMNHGEKAIWISVSKQNPTK